MTTIAQMNIFGETDQVKAPVQQRKTRSAAAKPTPKKPSTPTSTVEETNFTIRHSNASQCMPEHMLLLSPEYDATTDEMLFSWDDDQIFQLWDGILEEHLKQLRQTRPGSPARVEILKWQESENFRELCSAVNYEPDNIRDGVLLALENYDKLRETEEITKLLYKCDSKVLVLVKEAGLSRRECNTRRFKTQLAEMYLKDLRKSKPGAKKWEALLTKLRSDELRELAEKIGMDLSGVIERVKSKIYFIANPEDEWFTV